MNTTVKPRAVVKPSQSEVRAWARENGIEVSPRGTLPRAIVDAYNARGKGIQASDVKPAPAPVAAAAPASPAEVTPEPEVAPEPAPKPEADEVLLDEPDWSLPLTASDLREIADALDAFEKLPRSVLQLEEVPVMRPGGGETIGAFRRAVLFDDDEWFGFVPRGGAA